MALRKSFNLKFFSPRYLVQNFDWLEEKLGDVDDDYILFDCPGLFQNSVQIRYYYCYVVPSKLRHGLPVSLISVPLISERDVQPPFPNQWLVIEPTLCGEAK